MSLGHPLDDNGVEARTCKLLLLSSGDTARPVVDLSHADATAAVAASVEDGGDTGDHPGSVQLQDYMHAPQATRCEGHQ